jgi:hypothetical protein
LDGGQISAPTKKQTDRKVAGNNNDSKSDNARKDVQSKKKKKSSNPNNNQTKMIGIFRKIKNVYGFVADPSQSIRQNTSIILATMPAWLYLNRPTNLALHNLINELILPTVRSLLGLGLNFIPSPRYFRGSETINLQRFRRDCLLYCHFSGQHYY